jgi:ribosomal protein L40E
MSFAKGRKKDQNCSESNSESGSLNLFRRVRAAGIHANRVAGGARGICGVRSSVSLRAWFHQTGQAAGGQGFSRGKDDSTPSEYNFVTIFHPAQLVPRNAGLNDPIPAGWSDMQGRTLPPSPRQIVKPERRLGGGVRCSWFRQSLRVSIASQAGCQPALRRKCQVAPDTQQRVAAFLTTGIIVRNLIMLAASDPNLLIGGFALGGLVLAALWRLIVWVRDAPVTPDPWDAEVEQKISEPEAVEVCHRCFTGQPPDAWFCAHCGSAVGPYNNLMPYVHVFSQGEVFRNGLNDRLRANPLTIFGYLFYSLASYHVFAPVYWILFFQQLRQRRQQESSKAQTEPQPLP